MSNKVDEFFRNYNGTKYLIYFGSEKYMSIFNRIKYLIILTGDISIVVFYNFAKIKIETDDDLSSERIMNVYNVVILVKTVFSKNCNHYKFAKNNINKIFS